MAARKSVHQNGIPPVSSGGSVRLLASVNAPVRRDGRGLIRPRSHAGVMNRVLLGRCPEAAAFLATTGRLHRPSRGFSRINNIAPPFPLRGCESLVRVRISETDTATKSLSSESRRVSATSQFTFPFRPRWSRWLSFGLRRPATPAAGPKGRRRILLSPRRRQPRGQRRRCL